MLERLDDELAFGVKVFDPFVKERMVAHQFMNFIDFVNKVEIVGVMVGREHIKENMDMLKDKLILDTKNIYVLDDSYKL